LHDRGGDRDSPLLFHFHPVGGGMTVGAPALDGARYLDLVSVQQQLFGDGGFTGVRVRNDRKGAAFSDFVQMAHGDMHSCCCRVDAESGGVYMARWVWSALRW